MKHRDLIFFLFLQITLALALLMLSMSALASSKGLTNNQSGEFRHQEFASGVEEHGHHGEEVHHGENSEQHFVNDKGHDTPHDIRDHIDHADQPEEPLIYLFYWGILILVMVIIMIYFVYRYKHPQSKPIIPLAIFLVLFALSIFILEIITPTFSGRFDLETLRIVHEFHEGTDLGFLRFIYKFILGIFLTFFAFLNLDRKGLKQ